MNTRFYFWVTSNCNLSCRYCSQKHTMRENAGYEMSRDEVDVIVDSCLKRNIRFSVVELTGGEASMWTHLEYGYEQFSRIADEVTMVTNGNNAERVKALGMKHWIVSASQATPSQLKKYDGCPVSLNSHQHKPVPVKPYDNVLPAACCVSVTPDGMHPQNALEYIRGKVYYCCDAYAHSEHTGITSDIVCDFENDFLAHFAHKDYAREICRYCLCNGKIWGQL
ncbi:radical SAM protein [bacterium]|nr:radical SAM protein [bacterium]